MLRRRAQRGVLTGDGVAVSPGGRNRPVWGHARWTVFGAGLLLGVLGVQGPATAQSTNEPAGDAAGQSATGTARFQQGAYAQAAVHWMNAAQLYEQAGQTKEQCQALINVAHAFRQEGQIRRAQLTLQRALALSEQIGNRALTASILGQLGTATHTMGKDALAAEHLTKALALAREDHNSALVASLLNDLGNVLAARQQFPEAVDVYEESRGLAKEVKNPPLSVVAQINEATVLIQDGQLAQAQRHLDEVWGAAQSLPNSGTKVNGLLAIGTGYQDLHAASLAVSTGGKLSGDAAKLGSTTGSGAGALADGPLLQRASEAYAAAGEVAAQVGDARGQSYAYGLMGGLLERQRRTAEALDQTRKAVLAAQKISAPEASYRWQWQTARLLKAGGKEDEALAAYQRAVTLLKPIRYEYSVGAQGRHHSFYTSVAPLFLEVEDSLLRRAAVAGSPDQAQQFLVQVRDTVEASRAAELQDYFQDDCVTATQALRKGGGIPANTAVVYPIALPDRLELLVETATGLKQIRVPVGAETVTKEARTFRRLVQNPGSKNYLASAQTLYGWLVAPLQQDLLAGGITTLVMVPDGALRTIPMAALHDGRQFVIDKYAVALVPGIELTDLSTMTRGKGGMLTTGISEPVQGFPAVPTAATEAQAVRTLYGGTMLMDRQFSAPSFEQNIKDERIGIVHVASRSEIGHDAASSFVLAYDEKISMDRLAQMVGILQYRQEPLELLTLSACETAAEDDRAALGLSGVAVKTGARSAVASLWPGDPQSTAELVGEFYRQLQTAGVSKAVALQRAQQKILSQPGHEHPGFWAPLLLINDWR